MQPKLTIFERVQQLATKGIYVSLNTEPNSSTTSFLIKATVAGEEVLVISSNDIEAGLFMVVNKMEETTVFEYAATNNREGYILAEDVADAILKISCEIKAADIISVSKSAKVPTFAGFSPSMPRW